MRERPLRFRAIASWIPTFSIRARLLWACLPLLCAGALFAEVEEPSQPLAEARSAFEAGDFGSAERLFRVALLDDPRSLEAMVGWSRALGAQSRGQEALTSLRRRAEEAATRDDLDTAVELYTVAVEITPDEGLEKSELSSRRGQLLVLDRRYKSGEEALQTAWRSGQKDQATLLFLASALWENGNHDEAEARFKEAVALASSEADAASAHQQLGRFLLWRSQFAEAIQELNQAAKAGVRGFDFELDRARAMAGGVESGAATREQVIDAFRRLVEAKPEYSHLRYGLARALLENGQRDEAREQLVVYERLEAEDQERTRREGIERARLAEVQLLFDQNQVEAALSRLESMPEHTETLRMRALVLRRTGRTEEAAAELRKAIAREPDRQDLRNLLVEIERSPQG